MSDITQTNAAKYAAKHHLRLAEQLGSGIHGTVHVAQREGKHDYTSIKGAHQGSGSDLSLKGGSIELSAIKAHKSAKPYLQELSVYEHLRDAGVTEVLGFHVPQLIRADDELYIIEMTIVTRPFALDFAGAYLDARPEFPEESWAEWESQKREQFGDRWKTVEAVMNKFEELGIYLVDISPSNIAFAR